jgi:RNase H-like domain found in reverse transcriptase/Integrase zinc binding domain
MVADWAERWKETQVRSFEALREILAHPDFLVTPRPLANMKLMTDTSMYGLGAVPLQWEGEDAGWLPVAFASRKQKGAKARYTVTENECLAVLFGLQKFRQHLYGERFGVVTNHSVLVLLMSQRDTKHRLARWILEFQSFDFDMEYAPGNGNIMVMPDALSRDTIDKDLTMCTRRLETVGSVEEELNQVDVSRCVDLSVQRVTEELWKGFGDVKDMAGEHGTFLVGNDGLLYRVFTETDIRIVMPKTLRSAMLKLVHVSRMVGHWWVLRTAARLRKRFWWGGWYAAAEKQVADCLACRLSKVKRSRRQAIMLVWHPKARFEMIAVDLLEISPTSATGIKKVVVIGDVFYSVNDGDCSAG